MAVGTIVLGRSVTLCGILSLLLLLQPFSARGDCVIDKPPRCGENRLSADYSKQSA